MIQNEIVSLSHISSNGKHKRSNPGVKALKLTDLSTRSRFSYLLLWFLPYIRRLPSVLRTSLPRTSQSSKTLRTLSHHRHAKIARCSPPGSPNDTESAARSKHNYTLSQPSDLPSQGSVPYKRNSNLRLPSFPTKTPDHWLHRSQPPQRPWRDNRTCVLGP